MKNRPAAWLCLILAVLSVAVFGRTVTHDFINYDDNVYVYDNPAVGRGLSFAGARWALITTRAGNWHPLAWLSHMLDAEMFGLKPGGHHLVNVLLHALNAVTLCLVLRGLSGALWPAFLTAALFAVHPLHVQSVAWVSERKDLLSTLLGLAAVALYLGYARRPSRGRYLAAAAALALSLAAKPMLVTLPVLLLLLDWWPLGRLSRASAGALVVEKLPMLAVSAAFGVISILAQSSIRALMGFGDYPLAGRLANALVSPVIYVRKMLVPSGLAIFYPMRPGGAAPWAAAGALALLVAVTALCLRQARRRPFLAVGWLWYLVTLLPVSGMVQVGHQAMADRYTYVPMTGLFIMLSWLLAGAVRGRPRRLAAAALAAGVILAGLSRLSFVEAGYWKDSETIMRRALEVTRGNYTAHNNLATALSVQGRYEEAVPHLEEVLRIRPDHFNARLNLGQIMMMKGRPEEAARLFAAALALQPSSRDARQCLNLALAELARKGRGGEAVSGHPPFP